MGKASREMKRALLTGGGFPRFCLGRGVLTGVGTRKLLGQV